MTSYLAIDVGTTSIKGALVNDDGVFAGMHRYVYRRRRTRTDDAYIECSEISEGIREVLQALFAERTGGKPAAVSVSVLGEAICAVESEESFVDGKLLLPMDYRGESRYRRFVELFGAERLERITGHPVHPMFSLSKILWYLGQERSQAASLFLDALALVNRMLTGKAVTDHSIAARTQLYSIETRHWSDEILDAGSLDAERLPAIDESGAFVGYLRAKQLGLDAAADDIPVFLGGFDQACSAVGSGVLSTASPTDNVGTTICVGRMTARYEPELQMQTMGFQWTPAVLTGGYFLNGGSLSGGIVLDWCAGMLAKSESGATEVEWWLQRCGSGPSDLILLPYLTGAGAPHPDPAAKAELRGMTVTTSPLDVFTAALDSVCFESRLVVETMEKKLGKDPSDVIVVSGSPVRSKRWHQRKADVYGRPIQSMVVSESSVYGAAMIGAVNSQDSLSAPERSAQWCRVAERVEPSEHASSFDEKFQEYVRARGFPDR